ncbi:DUF3592 domain-containing protein [Streptomyces sp. NPDC058579]|uniref:DUF3592 domain-containing protein n=1 Tax=Streptomyces sp. NPDC058579 TaxID=3346548 RepID=UPI0036545CD0
MSEGIGIALCVVASVALLGAALQDGLTVRRLRLHGVRTHGMVVDNVRADTDQPMWIPVIEFTDQQGYQVRFTPKGQGTGMGIPTGRRVDVLYMADNPQTARVLQRRHMQGTVWSLLSGGLIFAGVAVWVILS